MSKEIQSVAEVLMLIRACRSGWSLPRAFYRDRLIFDLDLSSLFSHHWLFSGHVSQISQPGDYFTYNIGDESVIVVRVDQHEIRSYFNLCRHRGSRLVSQASGHLKRFVCPYHQWTYRLDGELVKALCMPDSFEPGEFGLHKAQVRVVEGLIFICLAETPPDFTSVEHDLKSHLQLHELEKAKVSSSRSYPVRANWKMIDENARECYHCPQSHPEYCRAVISAGAATSEGAMERARSIHSKQQRRWRSLGLDAENKPFRAGTLHSVNRFALHQDVITESIDGKAVAPLMGKLAEENVGVVGAGIYPNLLMEVCCDHAVTLRFTPLEPQLTEVTVSWYVSSEARENVDYLPARVEAVWRATAEQDWKLCEGNQEGVNSARYVPGPYASNEWGCDHFDQWYLAELRTSLEALRPQK